MQSALIINEEGIIIRPMKKNDISGYVHQFTRMPVNEKKRYILMCKKVIEERTEDDPNLYFAVVKDSEIIGAIITKSRNCDAAVVVDIPNILYKHLRPTVVKLFTKLCKQTYIYDTIVYAQQRDNVMLVKPTEERIRIACKKEKEAST